MTSSGTVHLDPAAHAAASTRLDARLRDLDTRRRAAEASVERLLSAWHGEAATAFASQWEAWSSAAAGVVDDLGAAVAALSGARGDLVSADTVVSQRPAATAGRLEGRLG
jgi:WXG100 family type VII secretion target